jgi:hypothetical protein
VLAGGGTAGDLEAFVAGLDPATAAVARELLTGLAAGAESDPADPATAHEGLRVVMLRLRVARIEEAMRDGRLLLEEAQRDEDAGRLASIEQRIIQLGHEKADATRAMLEPAETAGSRRS